MGETNKLPFVEICFYFVAWMFGIIYSLYHVFLAGNQLKHLVPSSYFTNGWTYLGRKKDNYDDEWKLWKKLILEILPFWFIIHLIGAQIIRSKFLSKNPFVLPLWYVLITSVCIIYNVGVQMYVLFLLQPLIFFVLLRFIHDKNHTKVIWIASFLLMISFSYYDSFWKRLGYTDDNQITIVTIALLWQHLKCISFSLCEHFEKKTTFSSLIFFFGYAFYLPTMFLGPIILFDNFALTMKCNSTNINLVSSVKSVILNTLRYLMWLYFTEFALHYIYINVLLVYIDIFPNKSVWLMHGLGYAMGQLFFNKYTIAYGLALTWTKAEGYQTPHPPKCIAHIHLYSNMWRYFDEGFYMFIRRYIYEPHLKNITTASMLHKMKISLGCFAFVFLWHGLHYNVLMWTFLNFFGLVIEMLGRKFTRSEFYNEMEDIMGYENERRIRAFFCAPLTVMSAISNFYFLSGADVGDTYFKYVWNGSVSSTLCLWFFIYSFCQVSIELQPSYQQILSPH